MPQTSGTCFTALSTLIGKASRNKIKKAGIDYELRLPSTRFNRKMGVYAGHHFDVDGNSVSAAQFAERLPAWVPTERELAYVKSLMKPVFEPGKIAGWIAPPKQGINSQGFDFEYVKFDPSHNPYVHTRD